MDWLLARDSTFRYMMLSRMVVDCEYFLGYGNRHAEKLWALNVKDHIKIMKALWNSFPIDAKPEWLTWGQIEKYEADME